jgi:hypothetical protein
MSSAGVRVRHRTADLGRKTGGFGTIETSASADDVDREARLRAMISNLLRSCAISIGFATRQHHNAQVNRLTSGLEDEPSAVIRPEPQRMAPADARASQRRISQA